MFKMSKQCIGLSIYEYFVQCPAVQTALHFGIQKTEAVGIIKTLIKKNVFYRILKNVFFFLKY